MSIQMLRTGICPYKYCVPVYVHTNAHTNAKINVSSKILICIDTGMCEGEIDSGIYMPIYIELPILIFLIKCFSVPRTCIDTCIQVCVMYNSDETSLQIYIPAANSSL